jgi:hypothetical protein
LAGIDRARAGAQGKSALFRLVRLDIVVGRSKTLSGKRGKPMNDTARALVEAMHRQAASTPRAAPQPPLERSNVHFTHLPLAQPGEPLFQEWNTYCGEVGRLLNEGQVGRYVLIKGETVVGIYDTWDAARESGLQEYFLEPFLVHAIRTEEPYLRVRGLNLPCHDYSDSRCGAVE